MRTWRAGILHRAKFKIARNSRSTVAILRRHRPEAGGGALLTRCLESPCFVPAEDGKPLAAPLKDVTARNRSAEPSR